MREQQTTKSNTESDEIWPPPPTGHAASQDVERGVKPKVSLLLSIVVTGILLSIILGALTNAINAAISPTYFYLVFNQQVDSDQVWKASIMSGIREAGCLGLIISNIFTAGASAICRSQLSYGVAVRYLLGISGGALIAWIFGGLVALSLAVLHPALYANIFGTRGGFDGLLGYAWVSGSIWGIEGGSLISMIVALAKLRTHRKLPANQKHD